MTTYSFTLKTISQYSARHAVTAEEFRSRTLRCRTFLALALVAFGSVLRAAAPTVPEVWTVVRGPHFTVLTTAAASTAQAWAANLERFRLGIGQVLPARTGRLGEVVVVIFPTEQAFRPYKLLQNGKPADIGGYFVRADSVDAIALAKDVNPIETRRIIFHEATHWFTSGREDLLPTWLEEGIAEVFSTFMSDEKQFLVGDSITDHVRYLRRTKPTPVAELVRTGRGRINYNDRDRTGQFYAKSWLFTHWVMFGENSPGPASIEHYLKLLKTAPDPELAFSTAFGGNYAAVERSLKTYLQKGKYIRRTFQLPKIEVALAPPREATAAEIEFALGALLFGARGPAEALPHLNRAAELDPENPRVWEAVGFAHLRSDNKPQALAAFDRATQCGSQLGLVWNNRAALRWEAEQGGVEIVRTSDREAFVTAAADFRKAIALDPLCHPAYDGLAGVIYGVEPFDPEDLARLEAGLKLFPEDRMLAIGLAAGKLRSENKVAAEAELRRLLTDEEHLPLQARRLGEGALEGEKLKVLFGHIELYNKDRRFGELVAELDAALSDNIISAQNRMGLRTVRNQAHLMQRVDQALAAYNAGDHADAAEILRSVLADAGGAGSVRHYAEQLLRLCEPVQAEPPANNEPRT